jgi:acyl phosphate:glycerol-3-phosphate acyltransferase
MGKCFFLSSEEIRNDFVKVGGGFLLALTVWQLTNPCMSLSPLLSMAVLGMLNLGFAALLGLFILGFMLGGIPFGYVAGRMKGIDIRQHGSGNIGATNVFRVMGKKWGSVVFVLDFAKAFLPVLILKYALVNQFAESTVLPDDLLKIIFGATIVCGHNFSPYMGFKGGKGMASSAGFIFALFPWSGLVCVLGFAVAFFTTRYVSLGSIVASVLLPISTVFFYPQQYWLWALALFLGLMSLVRHRSNMQRLWAGTENRAGAKKS